jgi:hypothetical protein
MRDIERYQTLSNCDFSPILSAADDRMIGIILILGFIGIISALIYTNR